MHWILENADLFPVCSKHFAPMIGIARRYSQTENLMLGILDSSLPWSTRKQSSRYNALAVSQPKNSTNIYPSKLQFVLLWDW